MVSYKYSHDNQWQWHGCKVISYHDHITYICGSRSQLGTYNRDDIYDPSISSFWFRLEVNLWKYIFWKICNFYWKTWFAIHKNSKLESFVQFISKSKEWHEKLKVKFAKYTSASRIDTNVKERFIAQNINNQRLSIKNGRKHRVRYSPTNEHASNTSRQLFEIVDACVVISREDIEWRKQDRHSTHRLKKIMIPHLGSKQFPWVHMECSVLVKSHSSS